MNHLVRLTATPAGAILRAQLLFALIVTTLTLTGCQTFRGWFGGGFSVPPQASAREQAQVADRQFRVAQQTVDEKRRREALKGALAAFAQVEARFPDDRVYTPVAVLMKGEVNSLLKDHSAAEKEYRRAIERYPDIKDVHASALYGLADSLIQLRRPDEANRYYNQLLDTYRQSDDPAIRSRVRRAEIEWKKVRPR